MPPEGSPRRRLNYRLLAILLLVTALMPVAVQLVHLIQVSNSARTMLARAQQAEQEGQLETAIRCYRYYVNYQPDDVETFSHLALLQADQARQARGSRRELWQVYPVLEQALMRDPDNVELLRRFAEVSFEVGRFSAAGECLGRLVALFPEETSFQFKLAKSMAATGEHRKAAEGFEAVIAREPGMVAAYVELSDLYRLRLAQTRRAAEVVEQMVAANPDAGRAHYERARYRWRLGMRAEAVADIERALEMAPEDLDVLLLAAELALWQRDYSAATQLLERAQKRSPADDRVQQALVNLKTGKGETEEAISLLRRLVEKNPEDLQALISLVDLQLKRPDLAAARATLRRMRSARYQRQIVDFFEGRVLMAEGKWREASTCLERVRSLPRKTVELSKQTELYLAQCYEQLGLPDRQLESYQRVLEIDPGMVAARSGLAAAFYQTRRPEQALQEYLRLLRGMGLSEFVRVAPLRNAFYQLFAGHVSRLPANERDWSQLERFVKAVEDVTGAEGVEATLMRVDLLVRQGKSDEARGRAEKLQAKRPQDGRLRAGLAALIAEQDPDKALQLLQAAENEQDSVEVRLARAALAVRLGASRGAGLLKTLETKNEKWSNEDLLRLWRGLGVAYYQLGDRLQTKRFWRRVLEGRPDDRQIRILMFESARESSDEAGMIEAVEGFARTAGTQSAEWKFCHAAHLVWQVRHRQADRRHLTTADQYLKQAAALRPGWQSVPCLEAEIDVMEGRWDDAIGDFRRAAELGALPQSYLGQFVRLLYMRGRFDEAREWLARLGQVDSSPALKMLGSELELRLGNTTASLEWARATVLESRNPIDFLWFGQLLVRAVEQEEHAAKRAIKRAAAEAARKRAADFRAEAELTFQRAVGLGPTIGEAWLALIAQLMINGKPEAAEGTLRMAQVAVPEDRAALVMAQGWDLMGQPQRAVDYYATAVETAAENFNVVRQAAVFFLKTKRRAAAQRQLEQLIRLGKGDSRQRPSVVWARRVLADLLAAEGGYLQQERALALLDDNIFDAQRATEDLRLKARILASRPLRQSHLQAIEILEEVTRDRWQADPEDRLLLAQLRDKAGRWDLCQAEISALLKELPEGARRPGPPSETSADEAPYYRYLRLYVQMLLQHAAPIESVAPYFEQLRAGAPKDQRVVALHAQMLIRQGKTAEAVALLGQLLPKDLAKAEFAEVRTVALTLEELKQTAAAEKLLQDYGAKVPRGKLLLAAFLSRHRGPAAALAQLEGLAAAVPAPEMLPVAVNVLREGGKATGQADFRRVQTWFDEARNKAEDVKELLLALANFLELQGKYADSIALYREFLDRSDISPRQRAVVANNLGYLMVVHDKNPGAALEMINEAIQILGPSPQLRDTRGLALLASGQNRQAIEELQLVVAEYPTAITFFHLALAQAAANDLPAASKALQTAWNDHQLDGEKVPMLERENYAALVKRLETL